MEIVATIDSVVFGGAFLMGESDLQNIFPKSAQYKMFLFRFPGDPSDQELRVHEATIESAMEPFALDVELVEDLAAENLELQETYIALFQLYLLLGVVVGIAGLSMGSLRAVAARRPEIGIMRSIGFKKSMVMSTFLAENALIAGVGIVIGILAATLAAGFTIPTWSEVDVEIPWLKLSAIAFGLLLIAQAASAYPAWKASKSSRWCSTMRNPATGTRRPRRAWPPPPAAPGAKQEIPA